ncbi:type II toxin-antitoxin system VapC family toxin [Nostoc spongiaeforme FACHB-130]|uniref:Type II toxin-antitoxin system VapC family toxin n=1 Tax=Nostoc spongiaeforme FACHB-130 TaxID=1357510 RepID=A0ABR8FMT7_9NOSO|nr:PIN domain-containing protein [Nostoc spongiaeforme]MBD2592789.1 type II toxin-antitoxin system VapC family toxin [Nostoc spongiaeforme FACHB-130]
MLFLMDTHTFIWYVTENLRLSNQVLELINDEDNKIFLSIASIWEMGIKQGIGKLTFNLPLEMLITQQISINDFSVLDIKISHVSTVSQLPLHHRDPFDRMLIAQAIVENLPILSADTIFDAYSVKRLW